MEKLKEPLDTTAITCEHDNLSLSQATDLRGISQEAYDRLTCHTSLKQLDVCRICVEEEFLRQSHISNRANTIRNFDRANQGGHQWIISSNWLKAWKNADVEGLPTDERWSILCEHGKPGGGRAMISGQALAFLRSLVGDFDSWTEEEALCVACTAAEEVKKAMQQGRKMQVKDCLPIRKAFSPRSQMFDVDYYAFPPAVYERFLDWCSEPGPDPDLNIKLCEHNGINFDPFKELPKYLDEKHWRLYCDK